MRRGCFLALMFAVVSLLFFPRAIPAVGPQFTGQPGLAGEKEVLRLSLPQAVALGLKNNLLLATARRSIQRAASLYRAAKAGYYPQIGASLTGSQNFQNAIVNNRLEYTQVFVAGLNISATMPLDLSGAVGRAVQQALILFVTEKANYAIASQGLITQLYQEYYDVLRGQASIKIDEAQLEQTLEQLRIARERLKAGRVPEADIITTQVQVDNARQNLVLSQGSLTAAKDKLRNTLVVPQTVDVIPTDRLTFQPEKFTYEQCLKEAVENRPEIKTARLSLEAARIALRSTLDPYRPTLGVSFNYGYNVDGLSPRDAWNNRPPNFTTSYGVTFKVPLFIFDGGVIRENRYRATVDIEQAKANIIATEENISLELKDSLTSLNNSQKRVEIGQASIKLAEESLKIAEMRYSTGVSGYLEVTDSRNNLRTAELNYLNALIEYNNAKILVYRSLGRPLVNDAKLQSELSSVPPQD
jgi:outer membrane protein